MEKKGIPYTVRQRFESLPDVFHGASIQVPEGTSVDELSQIEGVKARPFPPHSRLSRQTKLTPCCPRPKQRVWPVQKIVIPREPPIDDYVSTADSSMSSQPLAKRASKAEKRATTFPPASAYAGDTFYPHVETGIDALHNAGILGAGIKVRQLLSPSRTQRVRRTDENAQIAVLDAGVDYTNPLLGGCFGPGCHISFGYDFCGDNYNGDNTPVADSDPCEQPWPTFRPA